MDASVTTDCSIRKTGDPAFCAARIEYDPYGQTTVASGSVAASNPFRFSTKYWDEETGLGCFGYRYYSPSLGRWLGTDPLLDPASTGALAMRQALVALSTRYVAWGLKEWQNPDLTQQERSGILTLILRAATLRGLAAEGSPLLLSSLAGDNWYLFCANSPVSSVDPFGLSIRLLGTPAQQQQLLATMRQFVRGQLDMHRGGYLTRKTCSDDQAYDNMITDLINSENTYDLALVDKIPFFTAGQGAFDPAGWAGGTAYVQRNQTETYSTGFLGMGNPEPFTVGTALAHELVHAYQNMQHTPGADLRKPGDYGPALENAAIDAANAVYPRMGKPERW
jgi:RHS repeat-associated protein